jgi:hypothetical protein
MVDLAFGELNGWMQRRSGAFPSIMQIAYVATLVLLNHSILSHQYCKQGMGWPQQHVLGQKQDIVREIDAGSEDAGLLEGELSHM